MEETANIVKTYSEEMVVRWNTEIDTLLVYVRVNADHHILIELTMSNGCPGRFVFRSTDSVQCPILPTAHPSPCY